MEPGIKGKATATVKEENCASSMGSGTLPVFATPALIALMEAAAWKSVAPYLAEGQSTVGTKMEVSHTAASPLGAQVWAESELLEADGRKLIFSVSAFDEAGPIGSGVHHRFIVEDQPFLQKAQQKLG